MSIFEERRANDPQGLIDDMLAQVGRQAKTIGDLMKESERLEVLLVEAGIDPKKAPEPKKRRKKNDGQD